MSHKKAEMQNKTQTPTKKRTPKEEFMEFIYNLAILLAILVIIRLFVVSPFEVDGASMRDTLYDRDYIVIDKVTYRFSEPERGDVIVLRPPQIKKRTYFVKRIIGLPGDQVEFKEGKVYINDDKLDESEYLSQNRTTSIPLSAPHKFTIPEDSYFVMGDNRDHSSDSRSWLVEAAFKNTINEAGSIPRDRIVGKVRVVAFNLNQPFSRSLMLEDPLYSQGE